MNNYKGEINYITIEFPYAQLSFPVILHCLRIPLHLNTVESQRQNMNKTEVIITMYHLKFFYKPANAYPSGDEASDDTDDTSELMESPVFSQISV